MKKILVLMLLIVSGSFALASERPVAVGTVELHNAARSYEVVIDGPAAEKLFNTLNARETRVGQWLNKNASGIICGQNLNTKKFACSLGVDENGVQ